MARNLCTACYFQQRREADPGYVARRNERSRDVRKERRLADETWRETERARDRARTRTYTGNCTICETPGCIAKGLCRRCYNRTRMQEHRKRFPDQVKAAGARIIERARSNAEIVREAKEGPCSDCGGTFPQCVMDLDHVRGEKLFNLSNCGGRLEASVLAEIAKCDLVCSNCHRIRTKSRAKGPGMC